MEKINIIVDSHNDTMLKMIDEETFLPIRNLSMELGNHIDIKKLKKGGLNVPFFAAFTQGYFGNYEKDVSRTLAAINALYYSEKMSGGKLKIAYSLDDIKDIVSQEKIAAVSTIEGAYSLVEENAIELLKQYYDLGVRVTSLTWNYSNELGEGADKIYGDEEKTPSKGGLTELGARVIKEMNRLGMLVDVSHLDESTFWDVIALSNAPLIASHSGVYEIRKHQRNLNDKQLLAIKENGGVVGAVLCKSFISDKEEVSLSDYVDHIDYIVNLIGVDHVALGSDFDGTTLPDDIKDAGDLGKVIEELEKRGYSREDIEKIKYKNYFRLLESVEELKEDKEKSNIELHTNMEMGHKLDSKNLIFKANIINKAIEDIDLSETKIILDGRTYDVDLDNDDIYIELEESLKETFHVVTFKLVDKEGLIDRKTTIFYI